MSLIRHEVGLVSCGVKYLEKDHNKLEGSHNTLGSGVVKLLEKVNKQDADIKAPKSALQASN